MGNSALGRGTAVEENKVKASSGDGTPDFLDGKVDGTTMTVVGDQLVRAALTGGVTTVGNAATVVTNANLTGVVTSTGNATAIADKALALSKLADGTDGEIPTWDSAGVITTVPVGTSGDVLTSNGAGAEPTFQTPAGGGSLTLISTVDTTGATTGNITVATDNRYLIMFSADWISTAAQSPTLEMRLNADSNNVYSWMVNNITAANPPVQTIDGDSADGRWMLYANAPTIGENNFAVRGHIWLDTFEHQNGTTHGSMSGELNYAGDDLTATLKGSYRGASAVTRFQLNDVDASPQTHWEVKTYRIEL
jgi:hypothetical protein